MNGTVQAGDADDLFFDNERRRVYAICGAGVISVVQQQDDGRYVRIAEQPTMRGARTGLFVPARRTLYVAVPARPPASAEIRAYRAP